MKIRERKERKKEGRKMKEEGKKERKGKKRREGGGRRPWPVVAGGGRRWPEVAGDGQNPVSQSSTSKPLLECKCSSFGEKWSFGNEV